MMRSAKNKIRISQQDIGPAGGFEFKAWKDYSLEETWAMFGNNWALVEICGALLRGVDVELVTTNVGETGGAQGIYGKVHIYYLCIDFAHKSINSLVSLTRIDCFGTKLYLFSSLEKDTGGRPWIFYKWLSITYKMAMSFKSQHF